MLNKEEQDRLSTHACAIFQSIILPDVTPEGYILAATPDGSAYPDNVATHHFVDLCQELDPSLTSELVAAALNWFIKKQNDFNDPFFLTTLGITGSLKRTKDVETIENHILSHQRPSGYIEIYSGFLDGGSIFSTLWAIKILSLLSDTPEVSNSINKAFAAIESNWEDVHRTSFKGFYLELKTNFDKTFLEKNEFEKILKEIVSSQEDNGLWDNDLLYSSYILGNLVNLPKIENVNIDVFISKCLKKIFDLEKPVESIPSLFKEAKENYVDSMFLQTCIRAIISSVRYLRRNHNVELSTQLASYVFGTFPRLYFTARTIDAEHKKMNEQYGEIREHFSHLEKAVSEQILSVSPYSKNVFIMMPFRHDVDDRYEATVEIIKSQLAKHGFKGWLASDKNVRPQLWDNVASFMLACKFGISVFTRVEREQRIAIDEFNPNVSLELGFFVSRGKKVLFLKDKALPKLPSDLVGHLYQEFELNRVRKQLPEIIDFWVAEIKEAEKDLSAVKANDRTN